nr:DUF512 domain-containing protein [Alkalibaculum sporogenes]
MKYDIIIEEIEENSIAEELGIEPGDILLSVNDKKPKDILEYRYLTDEEFLIIEIQKKNGQIWQLDIEKDYDENIGIVFVEEIIDKPKSCHNNCVFCFINQLPKGMRESLYFKDDDTRLSFLHGNYVTLTNLSEDDINRIIEYRIQPINISVHTTNPELRISMLNNKKASNINILLKRFQVNKISMNIQIVLVPDYNDRKELDRTLNDLTKLYPYVNSISVVPVGLTKHRDNLIEIRSFTKEECFELVAQIENIQNEMIKKYSRHVVYPSDEFFIKGKKEIPISSYYEEFSQLENGVGMVSLFLQQCYDTLNNHYINTKPKKITIVTGDLVFNYINKVTTIVMKKYPEIDIKIIKIFNNFFGNEITVAGLITATDIIDQIKDYSLVGEVLFPNSMLRHEQDMFLDNISVEQVSEILNLNMIPMEIDGKKFIEKLLY